MIKKGAPFYSMFAVGDYTFAPYKVVWREQASYLTASVVLTEGKKPIITDHKLMMIDFSDKEESFYVCAMLNSCIAVFAAISYAIEIQFDPHILDNILVPRYDPKNRYHIHLVQQSKLAQKAAKHDDHEKLKEIEEEIDELAARIWGLKKEELNDIQLCLGEIKKYG
jgi:hypothetical protein